MFRHLDRLISAFFIATFCLAAAVTPASAWQATNMPGVENSVGFLSSGTSVEPRTTSESSSMIHASFGNWTMMLHANAFLTSIQQTGPRGGDKVFSANWLMPMLTRQFGRQSVTFRTMISLEPLTVTNRRYPLMFQTGESAFGLSILDGQHPHDLFMELAARYDFRLGDRSQFFVYGGPVGEAALGPTGFPHRASASENPLAVLGHHQQDSTHIASDVMTLGFTHGPLQLEASTFHGREPNENRWNFDAGKPDSFSTRLTVSPHKTVSAQFSAGRINSPEELDPRIDTIRTTASVQHNLRLDSGHVSSSLVWGRNKDVKDGSRRVFNSYNLEITSKFKGRNWIWTRIENVDRDRSLLGAEAVPSDPTCLLCGIVGRLSAAGSIYKPEIFSHIVLGPGGRPVTIEEDPVGRVQAFTLGYERDLPVGPSWLNIGIGGQITLYNVPPKLQGAYGNNPSTTVAFLRIRPKGNMADHMRQMHGP